MVPDTLGVHDRDRTRSTHPKAIRFCSVDAGGRPKEPELGKPFFQIYPRLLTGLGGTTLRFRGLRAQKYMPLERAESEPLSDRFICAHTFDTKALESLLPRLKWAIRVGKSMEGFSKREHPSGL